MNPAISLGLGIVDKGAQVAIEVLKKKNTEENRKYIDEYLESKKILLEERAKPSEQQMDNVIEHYEAKLSILLDVAHKDLVGQAGA